MKKVTKVWGEEQWLSLNEAYCFKRIFFKAGYRCSLQYHEYKLETIYVESGKGTLIIQKNDDTESQFSGHNEIRLLIPSTNRKLDYYEVPIESGFFVTINPGTIHRIEAITDLTTLEASTPEVDDCIRVQDDTNRPNGRIESEHAN